MLLDVARYCLFRKLLWLVAFNVFENENFASVQCILLALTHMPRRSYDVETKKRREITRLKNHHTAIKELERTLR